MKALSLMQPWASLLAMGIKKFETRGWQTHYRGPFLIHASKKFTPEAKALLKSEGFVKYLGNTTMVFPIGVILGYAYLENCYRAEDWKKMDRSAEELDREGILGDTTNGRYLFEVKNPVMFQHPVPTAGALNFFNVPLTELLEKQLPQNLHLV